MPCISLCACEETGTSSSLYRLALAGKAHPETQVVSVGRLVFGVLRWADVCLGQEVNRPGVLVQWDQPRAWAWEDEWEPGSQVQVATGGGRASGFTGSSPGPA